MAETLTFEQTPEVTSVESLSAEEQDSLEIGEKMQAAEDNRLAGKYENAQELEKAYIELEKKLGAQEKPDAPSEDSQDPPETEAKEEKKEDKPDETTTILDELWEQAQDNKYSDDTISKLNKMSSSDIAKMHLDYSAANQPRDLTENDVKELKGIVGGDENYANMMDWATKTLNKQEVDMFDAVMEKGDPLAAFFAVRSLAYRYNDAVGYEGKMVTGKAPKQNSDVFKSQAEVVRAMGDPRYDDDPAYRQEIMEKLQRSDVNF